MKRPRPRHCPRPARPVPWGALQKEIRALGLKVAAVAIRNVTILHELRAVAKSSDDLRDLAELSDATLHEVLDRVKDFRPEKPKGWFDYRIGLVQTKTKGNNMPLTIQLENTQQIKVLLTPKNLKGKPAKVQGAPVWEVESGDSTLVAADDGLSALLVTSDTAGDTVYAVKADADLGEGIETIEDRITLTVSEPKASTLGFTLGEPEDKPEAPPAPEGGEETPAERSKRKKR